jgi:hypothetical protein
VQKYQRRTWTIGADAHALQRLAGDVHQLSQGQTRPWAEIARRAIAGTFAGPRESVRPSRAPGSWRPDKSRILGTFNDPVTNWLSFFMFAYFTDRNGQYQLKSVAASASDPLARLSRSPKRRITCSLARPDCHG